jgi:3-oxoacyl-[acyl-carrier protein] reductase
MFRLDGKVALVSGAGRGMGFGIAQALAAQGAHVVVNDFHQDRAESAARQLREAGLKASAQAADLTDRAAIFAMVERIQAEVGVVDIFVHNAGIPAQGWGYTPFLQSPESEWNAWLQLNLHGLMHACQALLPAMQQRAGAALWPSTPTRRARPRAWGCAPMVRPRRRLASFAISRAKWARMA